MAFLTEKEKKKELNGSMSAKQELELRNQIRKQYYEDPESVEKMYKETVF